MSLGVWNYPVYCRRWKPGVSRHPVRWWLADPTTGAILAQYISVAKPTPPRAGLVVVSALVPR